MRPSDPVSRRAVVQGGLALGAGLMLDATVGFAAAPAGAPILRTIPTSGEKLPVVGVGTNAYGVNDTAALAQLKAVLEQMPGLGGKVIDTAYGYGQSEQVIGRLLKEIGNRDKFFLATKTPLPGTNLDDPHPYIDESFKRLQVERIDLLQVHNFNGLDTVVPVLRELKQAGKIRYMGATTSVTGQHQQLIDAAKKHKLDFIQVNYSINDRDAAKDVLPFAKANGVAVINNVPFGGRGRSIFSRVQGRPLPDFAKDIGATSWAQFFLKYNISNDAITAIIPGTTTPEYLVDNQAAGRGVVPDAAMRKRMEDYWATVPA